MTKTVLLNKENHTDLRVNTHYSRALGDGVMWVPTFAAEFRNLQSHYPILFQKDTTTGRFFPLALFGLAQGENLFLNDNGWDCTTIPLMLQRGPFSIGLYGEGDVNEKRRLIHIDLDHPKVSTSEGERLFETHGAGTAYLERVSGMLEAIHVWSLDNELFIEALLSLNLLEPVTFDITLADGSKGQLLGYYSIHEERLADLSAQELQDLNQKNFLLPIYMALASLSNIRKLIERKSRIHERNGSVAGGE